MYCNQKNWCFPTEVEICERKIKRSYFHAIQCILSIILKIAAIFTLCKLTSIKLLCGLYWLKIRIHIVYIIFFKNFTHYLEQMHRHVQTKLQQACSKNKLRLRSKIINKDTSWRLFLWSIVKQKWISLPQIYA